MAPPQKLYTRFLRQLVPLLALAYVLAAAITTGLYYQEQRTEAEIQRQQTLDIFTHLLTKPLWDCNSLTARGIIQAMTLQPNVHGATAMDQCAQKLIQAGTLPHLPNEDTLNTPLNYVDENGRTHSLGELIIAFQPISVFTAVSKGLVPQLAIFLSMLATVLACALWIFERTIGQPLLRLCQAMRHHQTLDPIPANWTEELTEVTQTYNAQLQKLRSQARHDPLTGLGNRRLLEEHLNRALRRAERTGLQGYVLLLDLDQFKQINDTVGHAAGDEVLRTVAQRLLACVRDTDTVTRLGGDEFVIVLPDLQASAGTSSITDFITRIRSALTQAIPWNGTTFEINASIGLAKFKRDGTTSTELLAQADANMYQDKAQKNKTRVDSESDESNR